jgi:hypothetical protein
MIELVQLIRDRLKCGSDINFRFYEVRLYKDNHKGD